MGEELERPGDGADPRVADRPLEELEESLVFWERRLDRLPRYRRRDRQEAKTMIASLRARIDRAGRERYGPGLLEQLAASLGLRRLPRLPMRGLALALGGVIVLLVSLAVAAVVMAIAFWPQIEPLVRAIVALAQSLGGGG